MSVDEDALRDLIHDEGVPIRLQVGDGTLHCIGWIDHADLAANVGEAMGEFLRAAAAVFDETEPT